MAAWTSHIGKIARIFRLKGGLTIGVLCSFVLTWFGIMCLMVYLSPGLDANDSNPNKRITTGVKDEKGLLQSSVLSSSSNDLNKDHGRTRFESISEHTLQGKIRPIVSGGQDEDPKVREKRAFIKKMMKDAWKSYEEGAWGFNEVRPLSQTPDFTGVFGHSKVGASIVDSLDTLFIMGLHDEYKRARDWVATELNFDEMKGLVSVFEINIRFVGGLLSMYALTGEEMYKLKAYELGKRLLPAFDTPTGIPYSLISLQTGECGKREDGSSVLTELGSMHLEFVYLSDITGDPVFEKKVMKIRKSLKKIDKAGGLYHTYIDPISGNFTESHVSLGAGGDSFYEYLLKSYLQNGDIEGREMYDAAMAGVISSRLIHVSDENLYFIGILDNGTLDSKMDHLACFAGGMFALGAYTNPSLKKSHNSTSSRKVKLHMKIGEGITRTCHESYVRTATGIGPENFNFKNGQMANIPFDSEAKYYKLRPEVIESYFVLWRLTGDKKYRDWAWDAATAIERSCKVKPGGGYSGLFSVFFTPPMLNDVQESFFMAETLKYLYLIFSSKDFMELDHWVFNTEAHPLPIKGTNPYYRLHRSS